MKNFLSNTETLRRLNLFSKSGFSLRLMRPKMPHWDPDSFLYQLKAYSYDDEEQRISLTNITPIHDLDGRKLRVDFSSIAETLKELELMSFAHYDDRGLVFTFKFGKEYTSYNIYECEGMSEEAKGEMKKYGQDYNYDIATRLFTPAK